MANERVFQRRASPNEQRTISREDLGFYHAVIIGAVYDLGGGTSQSSGSGSLDKAFFYGPLRRCVEHHPWLSVVVGNRHLDKSYYERVKTVNLESHVSLYTAAPGRDDASAMVDLLAADLDKPYPADTPPWRILILPMQTAGQYLVTFSFSHSLGDGISGPCFHKTFLQGLQEGHGGGLAPSVVEIPTTMTLPAPFDTSERLPISWGFLLKPLLSVLLPSFVANYLHIRASASHTDEGTWTGTINTFDDKVGTRTKVQMMEFDSSAVQRALQVARKHDVKLTGVLLQLITRALATHLDDPSVTNIVSQTAVNMRKAVGIPADEMGEYVSGCYVIHTVPPRSSEGGRGPLSEDEWAAARKTTQQFALASVQLQDQPIGLLRYAPSIRGWLRGRIGQARDCSVEMSNIGSFDGRGDDASPNGAKVVKMVFAQPGHVAGPPLCFNVASVDGGSLVCTVTWPTDALNIKGRTEEDFIRDVCQSISNDFNSLS